MQINQSVWRGFYQLERLRWDTAYNARAGAQILMRYVKDYAIPYAEKSGDAHHVPRRRPRARDPPPRSAARPPPARARRPGGLPRPPPPGVGRFDKAKKHPREERVDERLWTL